MLPDSIACAKMMSRQEHPIGGLQEALLEPREFAHQIVDWVAEKQAEDIILLDVGEVSLLADYFIICSGTTARQLGALAQEVRQQAKQIGASLLHLEGDPRTGWVLMDFADVVVHIFSPELRAYYRLEELWRDSNVVVRMP